MALPAMFDPIVNLPKPAKFGIGFGGMAVILAAVFFLLISPITERIGKLETELKKVEDEVAQNRNVLAQLKVFEQQAKQLEQQVKLLSAKLPAERDIAPLYRTISDSAFQAGLSVMLFQPGAVRVR